jgi:polysaccharide deacetylase family protein (PEP-CTERM system associated)
MLPSIFSVDVEDWFHILDVPSTPPPDAWDALPSRVEANFQRLLDLFDLTGTRTTCFFLGWVGARFPALPREAARRGHEVASHGHAHQLVHSQTRAEFLADVTRARKTLEDAIGQPVDGYRSPGFSLNERTTWFFEALLEAGYRYDSSVFPAAHGHGGLRTARKEPHWRTYAAAPSANSRSPSPRCSAAANASSAAVISACSPTHSSKKWPPASNATTARWSSTSTPARSTQIIPACR